MQKMEHYVHMKKSSGIHTEQKSKNINHIANNRQHFLWQHPLLQPVLHILSEQVKNLATVNKSLRLPVQQSTKLCTWTETPKCRRKLTESTVLASTGSWIFEFVPPSVSFGRKKKKTPTTGMCKDQEVRDTILSVVYKKKKETKEKKAALYTLEQQRKQRWQRWQRRKQRKQQRRRRELWQCRNPWQCDFHFLSQIITPETRTATAESSSVLQEMTLLSSFSPPSRGFAHVHVSFHSFFPSLSLTLVLPCSV